MKYSFKTITNDRGLKTVVCTGKSELGNKFVAKAVCSPEDEFDFFKGRILSQARVDMMRAKFMLKNRQKAIAALSLHLNKRICEFQNKRNEIDDLQFAIDFWER